MATGSSGLGADWETTIKDDLAEIAQNARRPIMYRVRRQLREVKPEHYDAEISLGLYNRTPLKAPKTAVDKFKIAVASIVLDIMGMKHNDWEKLCEMVVPNPEEIQDLYDDVGRDPLSLQEVKSVLTLDAVFLAYVLGCYFHSRFKNTYSRPYITGFGSLEHAAVRIEAFVTDDVFKVENQIPLSLIRSALSKIMGNSAVQPFQADDVLRAICEGVVDVHSRKIHGCGSYEDSGFPRDNSFILECHHLLDVAYRAMCRYMKPRNEIKLDMSAEMCKCLIPVQVNEVQEEMPVQEDDIQEEKPVQKDETDIAKRFPPAKILEKAGVKFEGRRVRIHDVEFKPGVFKHTLFLPRLTITDSTEVLWRNLVAYEDMQLVEMESDFTNYLFFMDKLINTPKDVDLLSSGKHPVIVSDMVGSNEAVIHLFNNSVLKNAYVPPGDNSWRQLDRKLNDLFIIDERRLYWLTALILVALLIVLTIIQKYLTRAGNNHG